MELNYKTLPATTTIPKHLILPIQTHSTNIKEIITGEEDLNETDGLWTKNPEFTLGVKTADCAAIVCVGNKKYGIVHAGWKGLVNGIIEKMLEIFADEETKIWIGPLHPIFEIQKDSCYEMIEKKFGTEFFTTVPAQMGGRGKETIYFDFISAIKSIIPNAKYCGESTFSNKKYASWRRDQNEERNITIVGKTSLFQKK